MCDGLDRKRLEGLRQRLVAGKAAHSDSAAAELETSHASSSAQALAPVPSTSDAGGDEAEELAQCDWPQQAALLFKRSWYPSTPALPIVLRNIPCEGLSEYPIRLCQGS